MRIAKGGDPSISKRGTLLRQCLLRRPNDDLGRKMRRGPLPPHYPNQKGGNYLEQFEQQLIRMELQVGQLIRIIAAMNERLKELEEKELERKVIPIHIRRASQRT